MKPVVVGLLLLWSCSLYAVDDFPPPFTAKYDLYAKGIKVGEGTRKLFSVSKGKLRFESIGETSGLIGFFRKIRLEEWTEFTHTAAKIRPLEYIYNQTGKKTRYSHIEFDWTKNIAINLHKGKTMKIPLEEGTLDKLLYQVVLMRDLKQGKRQLEYKIADKGKIRVYQPAFVGTERIKTGRGELETHRYERTSSNKKRRTTFWCAPSLHYLPVQVEHVDDGDVFKMVLQSVQGLD